MPNPNESRRAVYDALGMTFSVTRNDIDYFCEEMETLLTHKATKGSLQRRQEEDYLKWLFEKVGVTIREEVSDGD